MPSRKPPLHPALLSLLAAFFLWGCSSDEVPYGSELLFASEEERAQAAIVRAKAEEDAKALYQKAEEALAAGDEGDACDLYEEITEDFPNTSFAPGAYFEIGNIYASNNRFESAFKNYEKVLKRYPAYERLPEVLEKVFQTGERILAGERPYYWGIIPGFRDWSDGILYFEAVVKYAPYTDASPQALINSSELSLKDDEPEQAILYLDRLINDYPESLLTPDGYLRLARNYESFVDGPEYDQNSTRESIRYYESFLIYFPENAEFDIAREGSIRMRDLLSRSRLQLGQFYWYYRNDPRAARILLNDAITADPLSSAANEARLLIQRIDAGQLPPKTPYDYVFGRTVKAPDKVLRERPPVPAFEPEVFTPESSQP